MDSTALLIASFSLAPAILFAAAALASGASRLSWRQAEALAILALVSAVCAALWRFFADLVPSTSAWVGIAPLNLIMLLMISFLAIVVIRYSRGYLQFERQGPLFLQRLLVTLSAVSLVVVSNHMLILIAGWTAISLGLHQLLVFFPERPRAVLAAHKKFILARLAELSLVAAALLLYSQHQTWFIADILSAYQAPAALTMTDQVAAALIALAALIKCAQLPVHGWLTQVVEAPTPVSALLHAGIINLGGYLLILFGPLILQAAFAQGLVLVVAGLTALLASLVMSTRISVKVRLAWSTSAQMGLMLLEIALGLFELALLHLVAHSCYKAHSFLSAGTAVSQRLEQQLAPLKPARPAQWLGAALVSLSLVGLTVWVLAPEGAIAPWILMAMALSLVMAERNSGLERGHLLQHAGLALLLLVAYSLQKAGFSLAIPELSVHWIADAWAALLFVILGAATWMLRYRSQKPGMQRLEVLLFAGFYLDEWFTRTTLKLWPGRLSLPKQTVEFSAWKEELKS